MPVLLVLAATVFVNLGLAGVVGSWASEIWLRDGTSPWAMRSLRRSAITLRTALIFSVLADVMLLWAQAAYMADVSLADALAVLPSMLVQTYAGRAWSAGVLGLLLALAATPSMLPQKIVRTAGFVLGIGLFVYCRAAVSHAGDFGLTSPQLLIEFTHLSSISLWLGCVGIAAFSGMTETTGMETADQENLAAWVSSLSAGATVALIVILGTGLFNAWRSVGSAANLLATTYGDTLVIKSALVAIAMILGGINRFRILPRLLSALRTPHDDFARERARFVLVLRVEAVALFAALVAAAVLSSNPLPVAMHTGARSPFAAS